MASFIPAKSPAVPSFSHAAKREVQALVGGSSRGDEPSLDERVHETRKTIKRLRALLRLHRSVLDHAVFAREDARLRALGRSLGNARDAAAMRESLEHLVASAPANERSRLSGAMPVLVAALDRTFSAKEQDTRSTLRSVHVALVAFADRVGGLRLDETGFRAVAPGFRRTYGRGRRSLRRARHGPNAKRLHALRIAVKRLQYQLAWLEPLWPEVIRTVRHETQRLGDILGREHDLSLLERQLESLSDDAVRELRPYLLAAAEACHTAFCREAFGIASRVYAESPRRIIERFREYYRAATRDGSPAPFGAEGPAPRP